MKKVYIVCATGIATSSMLRVKIDDFLHEKGLDAVISQYRIAELTPDRIDADVIIATTEVPPEIKEAAYCINGLPLLTGIGESVVFDELEKVLNEK